MLQSPDAQLREMSAFALGRLAQVTFLFYCPISFTTIQTHHYLKKRCVLFLIFFLIMIQDPHNQAGIAHSRGIVPLLKLLESKNGSLQHNAAFALYGLADNEVFKNVEDDISCYLNKTLACLIR